MARDVNLQKSFEMDIYMAAVTCQLGFSFHCVVFNHESNDMFPKQQIKLDLSKQNKTGCELWGKSSFSKLQTI